MSSETRGLYRVLVAVPAFNEENTIAAVVERLRGSVPDFDLLVVDDGSEDRTAQILRSLRVRTARHPCKIGYGRSVQTAKKYALRHA
jgi:glycosyltransferase involved in cell wall biosynthesis